MVVEPKQPRVAVTQVVGVDDDDVRRPLGGRGRDDKGGRRKEREQVASTTSHGRVSARMTGRAGDRAGIVTIMTDETMLVKRRSVGRGTGDAT